METWIGDLMTNTEFPDLPAAMRAFRRRWASGVAVVTTNDDHGAFRGITVTAMMVVSLDPPVVAVALTTDGEFVTRLAIGGSLGVSVLETEHEFWSERFAGRAPVPDTQFGGIGHRLVGSVPLLDGALASCFGVIRSIEDVGDHQLVLVDLNGIDIGVDTDDPLLTYEAQYRRLEAE